MKLRYPCVITSSLMAGVNIGGAEVCIEYSARGGNGGRARYRWQINLPCGREFSGEDLQSGCGGGGLREGLESLLSFLGAFAESWSYAGADGENADLFPAEIADWAIQNSDEIGMAQIEVQETAGCIEE